MMNQVSVFQKKLDERQKVNDFLLFKVFYSIYWLAEEGIANKKAAGLNIQNFLGGHATFEK